MKLIDHTIQCKENFPTITLIPFGDIHADDAGFVEDLWLDCLAEIAETPNCLAIGLGDYRNFLRGAARKHLLAYTADEESFLELSKMVRRNVEEFYKRYLRSIQGKLIGLIEGNHFFKFEDSTTDTQYLCQLAGVPYLTEMAGIRLTVHFSHKESRVFILLAHHGHWSGGYSRVGGDLNAVEMKTFPWECDIALYGHSHRKAVHHSPIMQIPVKGRLQIVERPKVLIRTGSFVKGFVEDSPGRYTERKLLPPNELGYVALKIKFFSEYEPKRYQEAKAAGKPNARGVRSETRYRFEVRV